MLGTDLQHWSADATGFLDGTDITVCVDDDGHGPSGSSLFPELRVKDNRLPFLHHVETDP